MAWTPHPPTTLFASNSHGFSPPLLTLRCEMDPEPSSSRIPCKLLRVNLRSGPWIPKQPHTRNWAVLRKRSIQPRLAWPSRRRKGIFLKLATWPPGSRRTHRENHSINLDERNRSPPTVRNRGDRLWGSGKPSMITPYSKPEERSSLLDVRFAKTPSTPICDRSR